jgi:hypothetical protein
MNELPMERKPVLINNVGKLSFDPVSFTNMI